MARSESGRGIASMCEPNCCANTSRHCVMTYVRYHERTTRSIHQTHQHREVRIRTVVSSRKRARLYWPPLISCHMAIRRNSTPTRVLLFAASAAKAPRRPLDGIDLIH